MQAIYEQIINAASSDATVIIYGEPGTGKELVAHAIHDMSERRQERFVPVHCGAIPENLIESEFFGYVKGAFSGAGTDTQGYIDFAHQGTLFLDEIGEIGPHMQVKLLRVIEGGGYTPIGSNQVRQSDIRIIAATNRDMKERMESRRMRKDFFYRIHILPIYLPPLKQRKDDLPLLIDHFMMLYGGKKNLPPINDRMMAQLMAYDWPGNVRELQNVIIRYSHSQKIELMESTLQPIDATPPEPVAEGSNLGPLRTMIDAYEKKTDRADLEPKSLASQQGGRTARHRSQDIVYKNEAPWTAALVCADNGCHQIAIILYGDLLFGFLGWLGQGLPGGFIQVPKGDLEHGLDK